MPAASRRRHGARLLDPSDAPTIPGSHERGWGRTPSSTVYRSRTLLIPADLLRDGAVVAAINAALAPVGMSIVLPDLDSRPVLSQGPTADALRRLPRVAGLVPAAPAPGQPAVPVVVDAWAALQTLRAAAGAAPPTADRAMEPESAALSPEIVGRIGLEHLLAGSAVSPNAFCEGNDIEVSAIGGVASGGEGPGPVCPAAPLGAVRPRAARPGSMRSRAPRSARATPCPGRPPAVRTFTAAARPGPR